MPQTQPDIITLAVEEVETLISSVSDRLTGELTNLEKRAVSGVTTMTMELRKELNNLIGSKVNATSTQQPVSTNGQGNTGSASDTGNAGQ